VFLGTAFAENPADNKDRADNMLKPSEERERCNGTWQLADLWGDRV
jgi:hypothetical protein